MKREQLKKALQYFYSIHTVNAILMGKRTPQLKKALELEDRFNIPVRAWKDIKSFISNENSTTSSDEETSTNNIRRVS